MALAAPAGASAESSVERVLASVVVVATPLPSEPGKAEGCAGFFVDPAALGIPVPGRSRLIVTNSHCVEMRAVGDATRVGLYRGQGQNPEFVEGTILAYGDSDAGKDLALVAVAPDFERPGLPLAGSLPRVRDSVWAVGHPWRYYFTVTEGAVSALNRSSVGDAYVVDVFQHTAATNTGNSGGPVLDETGAVAGVNALIYTASPFPAFAGMAFAVPASLVRSALRQYARAGDLKLGTLQVAAGYAERGQGLIVLEAVAGGPAAAAGITDEDVILGIDEIDLADPSLDPTREFYARVKYRSPGEKVRLRLRRGDAERSVEIAVGAKPAPAPVPAVAGGPEKPADKTGLVSTGY